MKKCKLNEFCEKAFINVENTKGKANKVTITIKDEESYKIKLVKQRTEKQKNNARVNKIKSMGIAKPNQDKLLRMLYEGKINNTHITNIIKADINDALARLPNKIQAKVIDTIIKNTNEKNLLNSEEIASETIKNGDVNLVLVENWYQGILKLGCKLISRLSVEEEVLYLLDDSQIGKLQKLTNNIIEQCDRFLEIIHRKLN